MYTAGSTSKFSFSRSRRYLVRIFVASSTCWRDRPRFSRARRRVLPISIPVCGLPDSPLMLTQARLSLLPPGRPTSHSSILECTTPRSAGAYIKCGSSVSDHRVGAVREPPLLYDGLGQDPEAGHRVEDHQDEHRQLAPQGASRVTQEAQRDRVCEIDGDHVPGHDERDLRVPDEPSPYDAVTGLEIGGAEEGPTPSQRIRDDGDNPLPLDGQVLVVVGPLVGDRDGYERESIRGREPPETYPPSTAKDSAQFHKAEIDAEEEQRQQNRPKR